MDGFDRDWQIGDFVSDADCSDVRSLVGTGAPRWHCLTVAAQREPQTRAWLKRRGVYSFYPVEHRTVVRFGRRHRTERRYLPGYVFARFPGQMLWHRVGASPFVLDVVRLSNGEPGLLRPADLDALHAMRSVDQEARDRFRADTAAAKRARMPGRGDRARVTAGAFEDMDVEVVSIGSDTASVMLNIFGRYTPAQVALSDLHKL